MGRAQKAVDDLFRAFLYGVAEETAVRHFARRAFRERLKREPVLDPDRAGFNDKIYWRKVSDRNPLFPRYSDKVLVKDIVREAVGDRYVTPTLWHGKDLRSLAEFLSRMDRPYVVKTNHGAGWNIFVTDPRTAKIHRIARRLSGWLAETYGRKRGEAAYFRIDR